MRKLTTEKRMNENKNQKCLKLDGEDKDEIYQKKEKSQKKYKMVSNFDNVLLCGLKPR